jgi:hypothetical protein
MALSLVSTQTVKPFDLSMVQENDLLIVYHDCAGSPNAIGVNGVTITFSTGGSVVVGESNGVWANEFLAASSVWSYMMSSAWVNSALLAAGSLNISYSGGPAGQVYYETLLIWRSDAPGKRAANGYGTRLTGLSYSAVDAIGDTTHTIGPPSDISVATTGYHYTAWWAFVHAYGAADDLTAGTMSVPSGWQRPVSQVNNFTYWGPPNTARAMHRALAYRIGSIDSMPSSDVMTSSVGMSGVASPYGMVIESDTPPPAIAPGPPVCANALGLPMTVAPGDTQDASLEIPSSGGSQDMHLSLWLQQADVYDLYIEIQRPLGDQWESLFWTNVHGADVGAGALQDQRVHLFDAAPTTLYTEFVPGAPGDYKPDFSGSAASPGRFEEVFGPPVQRQGTWKLRVTNYADSGNAVLQAATLCFGRTPSDSDEAGVWINSSRGWISLRGPVGPQGTPGSAGAVNVYSTPNDPASTLAVVEGDLWIDTDDVPPQGSAIAIVFRTSHGFLIANALDATIVVPDLYISETAKQSAVIVSLVAKIESGTSIDVQVRRNGANVSTAKTVTSAKQSFALSQAITDGDAIDLVLSAPVGSPRDLGATVIIEHTVTS